MDKTIVHVMFVRRRPEGGTVATATIRVGKLVPPMDMVFATPEGVEHKIRVTSLVSKGRSKILELAGDPESLLALQRGYYLYSR